MNPLEHQSRWHEPVALGTEGPEPHPELVANLLVLRSDKTVRRLAKVAACQQRYLCDLSGFEHFLSSAALKAIEGADPVAWLEEKVLEIKREQVATRAEHALMTARLAGGTP